MWLKTCERSGELFEHSEVKRTFENFTPTVSITSSSYAQLVGSVLLNDEIRQSYLLYLRDNYRSQLEKYEASVIIRFFLLLYDIQLFGEDDFFNLNMDDIVNFAQHDRMNNKVSRYDNLYNSIKRGFVITSEWEIAFFDRDLWIGKYRIETIASRQVVDMDWNVMYTSEKEEVGKPKPRLI